MQIIINKLIWIIILIPTLLFSQDLDDFIRPFWGYYGSQSLTTSIGNATVASGHIIPGKTSNPANLGLSRFGHVQLNFSHGEFSRRNIDVSNTELGGMYIIHPVPVYQGNLVIGGGIQKDIDFSDGLKEGDEHFSEEGGIYGWDMGIAVEIVKHLYFGAEFQYLSGRSEVSRSRPETSSFYEPDFNGFNLSVGFVQHIIPELLIGASVEFPTYIWVDEVLTEWETDSLHLSTTETMKYRLTKPLVFHSGTSILLKYASLFYEMEWTDWRNLEFSTDELSEGYIADSNRKINDVFRATLAHHLGLALHPPWFPLHLYLGYQNLPFQYRNIFNSDKRESVSAGGSFMLNQSISVHGSYSNYYQKYKNVKENYSSTIFGITLHY